MLGRFTRRNQIFHWFRRVHKLKLHRWLSQPIIVWASIWNPFIDNFKDEIKNNQILKLLFETNTTKNQTLASFRLNSIDFDKLFWQIVWNQEKSISSSFAKFQEYSKQAIQNLTNHITLTQVPFWSCVRLNRALESRWRSRLDRVKQSWKNI